MNKETRYGIGLAILTALLFAANLFWGSVHIPATAVWDILCGHETDKASWSFIIWENRLPQAVTALLCGAALSVAGLLLQTAFRNPLAGPSILGIDSGASLGVAIVLLLWGGSLTAGSFSLGGFLLVICAALTGALFITGLLLFFSTLLRNNVMLLITGIMISYLTSSAISLLNYMATDEGVHSYIIWGMGNFSGVSADRLPAFATSLLIGLGGAFCLTKPLNALLLGDRYAENLGISIRRTRTLLLCTTGLLTAVCTAFCGPIAFVGLSVPHLARLLTGTANHRSLLPGTLFTGASLTLLCNLISTLPGESGLIPLNVITPVLGAPVIIYVILQQKR
ncbi:MAG: iron ABC transporter permease [Paraprevotella sp.]|nr:iron ABC transporter permease [Paraprevotella sp.]